MSMERTAATMRARPWRELANGANGSPVGPGVDRAGFEALQVGRPRWSAIALAPPRRGRRAVVGGAR
jgi:hypothetical protein